MQVQEPEKRNLLNDIKNSGRPLFIPEGLHAGREIFSKIAGELGLTVCEYPLSVVKNLKDPSLSDEIRNYFNDKPALFLSPTNLKINGKLIDLAKNKVYAFASVSTGTDHVNLTELEEAGIHFIHAPGANSRSVVEYVLSALPLLYDDKKLLKGELSFGIIGYGRIGSLLGKYLDLLGFSHKFYDPFVEGKNKRDLEDVLHSDVVTFHVPLTKEGKHATYRMVNETYLSKIPAHSLLMNTARGPIFTEESYQYAIRNYRTVMDVFPVEPPSARMLEGADFVSPHIAGYNYSARAGGTALVAKNFMGLLGYPDYQAEYHPGEYHFYTLDFLAKESADLKKNPESFRNRRENYPDRGDFFDFRNQFSGSLTGFPEKILKTLTEI